MNTKHTYIAYVTVALLGLIASVPASAVTVEVNLTGIVSIARDPLLRIRNGDKLSWTFVYEVDSTGACSQPSGDQIIFYRCENNVISATATLGDIKLNELVVDPDLGFSSFISVRDYAVSIGDNFQGVMAFRGVEGISRPILTFSFNDMTGTAVQPNPKLPTAWSEQSLLNFDYPMNFWLLDRALTFTSHNDIIAQGFISRGRPLVPEPSVSWLLVFGLIGIAVHIKSAKGASKKSAILS